MSKGKEDATICCGDSDYKPLDEFYKKKEKFITSSYLSILCLLTLLAITRCETLKKAADYELGIKITDERVNNVCGQIDSRIRNLNNEIGECTKILEKLHRSQADTRDAKDALRAQDYRKLELISQQYQKEIISYVAEWKYMMSMKSTGNDKARADEHGPDYPGNPDEVGLNNLIGTCTDRFRF